MSVLPVRARSFENAGAGARAIGACALLLFEIVALDALYDVRQVSAALTPLWLGANEFIKHSLYAGLYGAGALALLLWPQRRAIMAHWQAHARGHAWRHALAANLILFVLLVAAMSAARMNDALTWSSLPLLMCGALAMASAAAFIAAPWQFWLQMMRGHAVAFLLAGCAGAMIAGSALMAQNSWSALSGATLHLSYAILALFEPQVEVNVAQRLLGVGDFRVIIDSYCSGYEGVGLFLSALGLYLFLFRKELRFPAVLVLLPFGAALIWLLNGVRIAVLVALGAHVSPELALTGFHSQAGWILFVGVTAALMALAQIGFHRTKAAQVRPATLLAAALLAPFAALMAARIVAGVFAGDPWAGAWAIVLPAAVIAYFWRTQAAFVSKVSWEGAAVGAAVGALWIITEPVASSDTLGPWIAAQEPVPATIWLALRIFGFALIVPIAEELAFRGYLHRALARRRFEEAQEGGFSWIAFIATSLAFGLMHERWLAGALAGAAYALVLYRTKSLAGPISAHIASNGLIAAYALATGAWALL